MSLEEVGEPHKIYSTAWHNMPNHGAQYKHFYAFKGGKVFVAVATRTNSLRFLQLPMTRGTTMELEFIPNAIESDEIQAKNKVVMWLMNQ